MVLAVQVTTDRTPEQDRLVRSALVTNRETGRKDVPATYQLPRYISSTVGARRNTQVCFLTGNDVFNGGEVKGRIVNSEGLIELK